MGNTRQNINNFDELYQQARVSNEIFSIEINRFLAGMIERNPELTGVVFEQGPLKEEDNARGKIARDYGGDASRIGDLVRGRFVVQNKDQIEILRREILSGDTPFIVEALSDQFAEPTNSLFRAVNSKVRLPNGHIAELRIEHVTMLEAGKRTHDLYKSVQEIQNRAENENRALTPEEKAEITRINREISLIHDEAARKTDLDILLNENGRSRVDGFREQEGITVRVNHAEAVNSPNVPVERGEAARAAYTPSLGAALGNLTKHGSRYLPVVGAGVTGAIASELLARAHGNVSDEQFAALAAGAAALIAAEADPTNAGQLVTEELVDAGLDELGIPEQYRFGTTRQALQDVISSIEASLRTSPEDALRDAVYEQIMSGRSDIPESLQSLTEARTHLEAARDEINTSTGLSRRAARGGLSRVPIESVDRYLQAAAGWQTQFDTLMQSDPQAVRDMVQFMPADALQRLVRSAANPQQGANLPDSIQQYIDLNRQYEQIQQAIEQRRSEIDEAQHAAREHWENARQAMLRGEAVPEGPIPSMLPSPPDTEIRSQVVRLAEVEKEREAAFEAIPREDMVEFAASHFFPQSPQPEPVVIQPNEGTSVESIMAYPQVLEAAHAARVAGVTIYDGAATIPASSTEDGITAGVDDEEPLGAMTQPCPRHASACGNGIPSRL